MVKNNNYLKYQSKEYTELFEELKKEFEGYEEARKLIEREWIVNYLQIFTKEKYILKENGDIYQLVYLDNKNKNYVKPNKLYAIYKMNKNMLYSAFPLIQANPVDISSDSELAAELAETIIQKEYKEWKKNGLFSKSVMWFLITGNAFCEIYNDENGGSVKGYDEQTKRKIMEGKICIKSIPPFYLYFSPLVHKINEAPRVFKLFIMHKSLFKNLYPEATIPTINNFLKYKLLLTGDYYNWDRKIDKNDYVELIKVYEPPNYDNENGRLVLMTRNQILDIKDYPFKEIGLPFAQAKLEETGFSYGETPFTLSTAIDREYSLFRGQLAEYSEKANPFYALPYGSTLKAEQLGNRNLKVIYYNQKIGMPTIIQGMDLTQTFYRNLMKTEEDLSDINSVHPATLGKREEGVRSGLHQISMAQMDSSAHQPFIYEFYRMFEDAGNIFIKFLSKYETSKRYILSYGKENINYLKYSGEQLEKANIEISVIAGLPLNRNERQQVVLQFLTAGLITKNQALQILEFGELNQIFKSRLKDKVRQRKEIQDIIDNNFIEYNPDENFINKEVEPHENHLVAIEEIIKFAKTSMYFELPEKTKLRLWQHAEMHLKVLMKMINEYPLFLVYSLDMRNIDEVEKIAIEMQLKLEAIKKASEMQQNVQPQEGQGQGLENTGGPVNNTNPNEYESVNDQEAIKNKLQAMNGLPPQITSLQQNK